jgi:tetratricopeptide (TPR) repeat protein
MTLVAHHSPLLFRLQLASYIFWFSLQVGRIYVAKYRLHLVLAFLLTFVGVWLLLNLATNYQFRNPSSPPTTITSSTLPLQPDQYLSKELTALEIRQELNYWLELAELQPTHRDILINISLLYLAIGDNKTADEYWQRANEIDPNFSAFHQPL